MTDQEATGGATAPAADTTPAGVPAAVTAAPTVQQQMAQALVDRGTWTKEQAATALAAEGVEGETNGSTPAEAEAAPYDRFAAVADMKSTLAAVGIEGEHASAIEHVVQRGLARAPTPEQNAQECVEVRQWMDGLYGAEKAGWMVEWARREFQHLAAANPRLIDLAERSGAGNSLHVIQQLAYRGINRYNKARMGK